MSVGTKLTDSVCDPAPKTVPLAGVYVNVPATEFPPNAAVAFNCVALRAVPKVIAAGFAHVITGVALPIVTVWLPVVDAKLPIAGALALMVQVPVPVGVTVEPERLHGPVTDVKLTVAPEVAVAVTVNGVSNV